MYCVNYRHANGRFTMGRALVIALLVFSCFMFTIRPFFVLFDYALKGIRIKKTCSQIKLIYFFMGENVL